MIYEDWYKKNLRDYKETMFCSIDMMVAGSREVAVKVKDSEWT